VFEGASNACDERHCALLSYFALVDALEAQDEDLIRNGIQELVDAAQRVPVDFFAPYYKQAFLRFPYPYRKRLYPLLNDVICSLLDTDAQSDIVDLLEALPVEEWWEQLPTALRKLKRKPEQLDVRLLTMLVQHSAECPRGRFPESLWQHLIDLVEQSPCACREAIRLAYEYPEQCRLGVEELGWLEEHERGDAKSLYLLSELWSSRGDDVRAGELAWKAFCFGGLSLEDLNNVFYILCDAGTLKLAQACAGDILSIPDAPTEILAPLGVTLVRLDDLAQAEQAFHLATQDPEALEQAGWEEAEVARLFIALREWPFEQFLQQYQSVKEWHTKILPFHLDIVERLISDGQPELAISEIEAFSLLEATDNAERVHLLLARALEKSGSLTEALRVLERSVEVVGRTPAVMHALLSFWWRHEMYRRVLEFLQNYAPPNAEIAALAAISFTEGGYFERALKVFRHDVLEIGDTRLRDRALRAYITSLAQQSQWEDIPKYVGHLPAETIVSQWGQFHLQFSNLLSLVAAPEPDPAAIALSFERLLAYPLTANQLKYLTDVLLELFRERSGLRTSWRFLDIHDYILLHVADMVERSLAAARRNRAISRREIDTIEQKLEDIQLDTAWAVLDDLALVLRSVDHGDRDL
jgi:hypothetical protein